MACNPLITDAFAFPRRLDNRPGLPRIAYRIGEYPDFVEAMTRTIDAALPLASWTHREPDDPGIALLECAAILGDILTFYQDHYANEAYLRTSAWRDSIAELVRLTGYRLAPGIGGRGTFAFEVRGTTPVTIRKGFPLKADLEDVEKPADFQTESELIAWPHLGRFNLLRPRSYAGFIAGGPGDVRDRLGRRRHRCAHARRARSQGGRPAAAPPRREPDRAPDSVLPGLDGRSASGRDRRRQERTAAVRPPDRHAVGQLHARLADELPRLSPRPQLPSLRLQFATAIHRDQYGFHAAQDNLHSDSVLS